MAHCLMYLPIGSACISRVVVDSGSNVPHRMKEGEGRERRVKERKGKRSKTRRSKTRQNYTGLDREGTDEPGQG